MLSSSCITCMHALLFDYDNRIKHRLTESMIIIMNTMLTAQLENFVHYCILYWSSWGKLYKCMDAHTIEHEFKYNWHSTVVWFSIISIQTDVSDVIGEHPYVHPCRTPAVIDHLEEKVFELTHTHTHTHTHKHTHAHARMHKCWVL